MDIDELAARPDPELDEAIGQCHALSMAARVAMVELVCAFDRRDGWRGDGATGIVGWLVARVGLSHRSAAHVAEVARALADCPAVRSAAGEGRLSWDQLVQLARFVTADTDERWAREAPAFSVEQLRRLAARANPPSAASAADAHRQRSVRLRDDHRRGGCRLSGYLPTGDAETVKAALERMVDRQPADVALDADDRHGARHADALVQLASEQLAADADHDRATVVLHVDAATAVAATETGTVLSAPIRQRLACDARLQVVVHGEHGPVGVGRTSRQVPAWLVRQLRHRDNGCTFPGCHRSRWVHAHHLIHWEHGGPTTVDNLTLLCGHHHRLVHDAGWTVRGSPAHLKWFRPDGTPLDARPPPLHPDTTRRLE